MPILSNEDYEQRAMYIVKYQNFKTEVALKKIPIEISKPVFNAGVSFIKNGYLSKKHLSKLLIKEIKRCQRKHIQPLTPSVTDKRIERHLYRRKRRRIITEKVTSPIENHNEKTITIPQPESKMKDKINEKIKILSIQLDVLKELLEQQ